MKKVNSVLKKVIAIFLALCLFPFPTFAEDLTYNVVWVPGMGR